MFLDYIEVFLKKYNLKIEKVHRKYITIGGKNCSIRIWNEGRVQVMRDGVFIECFKFDEKTMLKYI
jgi:hypothetical protein